MNLIGNTAILPDSDEIGGSARDSAPISLGHALKGAEAIRLAADTLVVPRHYPPPPASGTTATRSLHCRSVLTQHIGFGRENQEDSVLSVHHTLSWAEYLIEFDLAILADGCGGCGGGEIASAIVCYEIHRNVVADLSAIARHIGHIAERDVIETLNRAFSAANAFVLEHAAQNPECSEMASTAVCVLSLGNTVYFAWAGDSRASLYRDGRPLFRTKDHRRIQTLIDLGVLSPEDAARHPDRNVITRAIGIRGLDLVPDIEAKEVQIGDLLILSSDGFHEGISDEYVKDQWTSYLKESPSEDSLRAFARALESQSLSTCGDDNLSSVVMLIE